MIRLLTRCVKASGAPISGLVSGADGGVRRHSNAGPEVEVFMATCVPTSAAPGRSRSPVVLEEVQ